MTARIDIGQSPVGRSVQVAGWLDEAAARELLDVCSHQEPPVLIDIAELISADQFAIQALRDLRSAGARIVGASPHIALRLGGGPAEPARTMQASRSKGDK